MFNWDDRALDVLNRLTAAGHRPVLVGGCVRDSLLGIPPHDYDAATSALPDEIRAACAGLTCLEIGLQHGTITVILSVLLIASVILVNVIFTALAYKFNIFTDTMHLQVRIINTTMAFSTF